MGRTPTLTFDRGTLILHPPPRGRAWLEFVTWDDRVERFRMPASRYRDFVDAIAGEGTAVRDEASAFEHLELEAAASLEPFAHQREALDAWLEADRRGVVVLPTGSGKSYLAQLAMQATGRSTLIVVPTLDLLHQWYANLEAAYPGVEVGVLGGGSRDRTPLLVSTYDSAAIHADTLGNRYGLLVFDECHHLAGDFLRQIAESSLAPHRLGLTATLERSDGRHEDLFALIGPLVYERGPRQLAGDALAEHRTERLMVRLSLEERAEYDRLVAIRNGFLRSRNIFLGSLDGWQQFVRESARSKAGRAAMLAHREARRIAFGTEAKLRLLRELLARHERDRVLVFTDDNATVYRVSKELLVPAITHQTKVKERHEALQAFREGRYPRIVTSRVLNEGVDVPEANVAIVLSGTGSAREYVQRLGRILRRREGKLALLYEIVAEDTSEEGVSRRRQPKTPELDPIASQEGLAFEEL